MFLVTVTWRYPAYLPQLMFHITVTQRQPAHLSRRDVPYNGNVRRVADMSSTRLVGHSKSGASILQEPPPLSRSRSRDCDPGTLGYASSHTHKGAHIIHTRCWLYWVCHPGFPGDTEPSHIRLDSNQTVQVMLCCFFYWPEQFKKPRLSLCYLQKCEKNKPFKNTFMVFTNYLSGVTLIWAFTVQAAYIESTSEYPVDMFCHAWVGLHMKRSSATVS